MRTLDLIDRLRRKPVILIGSRPGAAYAGLTDRQTLEDVDAKVLAVRAFAERHDPDIVFTITGMFAEAESLGASVEVGDNGYPRLLSSPLGGGLEAERLQEAPLLQSRHCRDIVESIRRLSAAYPQKLVTATVNGPVTVAGQLLGLERMLLLTIENPHALRGILPKVTRRLIEFMEAQVRAGARYVSINEPSGSLLPPAAFRELCLPRLQELFRAATRPNHLHICGQTNGHLEALAEVGAHAVSVDAMVDMERAARLFGPQTAVCGQLESAGVLLRGTAAEVARETAAMLDRMSRHPNYIPATSCAVPRSTPAENVQAFIDTVRCRG